jgi:hypothetical protein
MTRCIASLLRGGYFEAIQKLAKTGLYALRRKLAPTRPFDNDGPKNYTNFSSNIRKADEG